MSHQELFCSPDEQIDQFAATRLRVPPSLARGNLANVAMDPADFEDDRDTTRDGIGSIAMDLGTDVSRSEQGQAGLPGEAGDTVGTVTDSEAEPHLLPCPARGDLTNGAMNPAGSEVVRHDQCHSGMWDTVCEDTASIAMDPDRDEITDFAMKSANVEEARHDRGLSGTMDTTCDDASRSM